MERRWKRGRHTSATVGEWADTPGSRGQIRAALLGGLILGVIGFVAGYFGPIIVTPEANQGPLLGIFITGPLGFVLGMIGGAIVGVVRRRRQRSE